MVPAEPPNLGAVQEESSEVYYPIALLRGAPGASDLEDDFVALLRAGGYDAVPLDLDAIDEETLAEYDSAVLPARGALDLDHYGSLVVYVLRGGSLITFPEPPTRQPDGAPFRSTFLWPYLPAHSPALRPGAGPLRLLRRLLGTPSEYPVLSETDGQPLPVVGPIVEFPSAEQPFVRYGTGYSQPQRSGGPVALRPQVLLRRNGIPVAYRAQVRDGVSTVVGADLGATYASDRYRTLTDEERLSLQRFVVSLFE